MAVFSIQHPTFYLLNSDWAKFRIASISLLHWTLTRFQGIAQYPHSVTPRIPRSSLQHCSTLRHLLCTMLSAGRKEKRCPPLIWRLFPCPTENNVSSFADSSAVWSLFRGRTFVNTSCSRMYVFLPLAPRHRFAWNRKWKRRDDHSPRLLYSRLLLIHIPQLLTEAQPTGLYQYATYMEFAFGTLPFGSPC